MERKQGIYLNDERVSAEANAPTVSLVDKVLRTIKGSARMEVWSKSRLVKSATYADLADGFCVDEGDVGETLPKV